MRGERRPHLVPIWSMTVRENILYFTTAHSNIDWYLQGTRHIRMYKSAIAEVCSGMFHITATTDCKYCYCCCGCSMRVRYVHIYRVQQK